MADKITITVAKGDGIGPEIMDATLEILDAAGAKLNLEEIKIGKEVYESGVNSGIDESSWDSLRRNKVFLKAPITTPQGGGYKSLNVTIRKTLGLYANVRPCVSYHPCIKSRSPGMNLTIIRENEEDLYGGIEYRQSQDVMASIKLISRQGSERISRYAFEYARKNGFNKVTCMTKDNIMKLSDGLFHSVFDKVGESFPEIDKSHMIIDIGAAKVAAYPEMFEVIVVPNLYGDILSDIALEITGSVGMGGSANIGASCAMFEAVHGSAPDIAGKGIANPSGLLNGAIMMLNHIGLHDSAEIVHNAWLKTIEEGIHTGDVYKNDTSRKLVNTKEFTKAVVERLGEKPAKLKAVSYKESTSYSEQSYDVSDRSVAKKERVGVDVSINWYSKVQDLVDNVEPCVVGDLELVSISNRGVKVWPEGFPETFCTDNYKLRFFAKKKPLKTSSVVALLENLNQKDLNFTAAVMLHDFDGKPGYSVAQGT